MTEPTLNEPDLTNAKRMALLFGAMTLVFVCGGGIITGIAGYGSESDGLTAATIVTGPGCCSLAGLLAAAVVLFGLKPAPTAQIIAPIAAGIFGGIFGAAGLFIFLAVIWPAL